MLIMALPIARSWLWYFPLNFPPLLWRHRRQRKSQSTECLRPKKVFQHRYGKLAEIHWTAKVGNERVDVYGFAHLRVVISVAMANICLLQLKFIPDSDKLNIFCDDMTSSGWNENLSKNQIGTAIKKKNKYVGELPQRAISKSKWPLKNPVDNGDIRFEVWVLTKLIFHYLIRSVIFT